MRSGPFSGFSTRVPKISRGRKASFSASPELAAALSGPLLEGEDPAAFSRLVDDVVEAFNPLDAVEYIFAREFAQDTWAINRCKRMKIETVNEAITIKADSKRPHLSIEQDPMYPAILAWRKFSEEEKEREFKRWKEKYGHRYPKRAVSAEQKSSAEREAAEANLESVERKGAEPQVTVVDPRSIKLAMLHRSETQSWHFRTSSRPSPSSTNWSPQSSLDGITA
jgi:hypothetical protein